jgi:glycosyltransferase involved in cell wall biosynthesis
LRVMHVDTATQWRGGQVQLLHLVRGMVARGHEVLVGCVRGAPLWSRLEGVGAQRLVLPAGRSLRGAVAAARQRVDLVAAHTSHAHTVCLGLALVPRAPPLVVHRRVDFLPSGGWKYRQPAAIIAVSHAVARALGTAGVTGVTVVHSGVVPPAVTTAATDAPTVLAVGALVAHKGHDVLARAAAMLPGVDIGVVGEGSVRPTGMRLLGWRDDVPALLAGAQVFVHPSIQEGLGTAAIEAMMAGLPVVVTDAGGLPEVVGEHGICVPAGDAEALADGIRRALAGAHPSTKTAQDWARERFSVDRMVDETITVYERVISEG